jgi:hypothetical protein
MKTKKSIQDRIEIISSISFEYWANKNPYFSSSSLNKSMKASITLLKKRDYLRHFNPKSALEVTQEIKSSINGYNFSNPNFDQLSYIFDLIQAWGGQTGRSPYIQKKGAELSSRENFENWKFIYNEGAEASKADDPLPALKLFNKINGLGRSFAPKHLMFWSNIFPILDSRISLLICGSNYLLRSIDAYNEYIEILRILSTKFNSDLITTEKALFAFSQHYYPNNTVIIKKDIKSSDIDYIIAKKLESCILIN